MLQTLCRNFRRMPFYAVAHGRSVGIFNTWPECEAQVKGYTGAIFKRFKTTDEAKEFINQKRTNATLSTPLNTATTSVSFGFLQAVKRTTNSTNNVVKSKKSKIDEDRTSDYTSNIKQMKKYDKYYFMEDENGFVHVYTDGSCENNGKPNAIAGYGIYFGEGHSLNTAAPVVGPATNNRGEIQAVTKAIKLAAEIGIQKLCINSDSHFVINSVTEWMDRWKSRNWRLASGGQVKNEIDFRDLDRTIQANPQIQIQWKYVPAHTGILGNERADELAREGSKSYKK